MPWITRNETQIHYEVHPCTHQTEHPETIVLAHGLGLDMTTWEFIIPHLIKHYDIVRFDFRGHGKSTGDHLNIQWRTLFEDFNALISELNLSDYHFVGHGLGGHFGVELLTTFPNEIKTFTVLTTTFFFPHDFGLKELQTRQKYMEKSYDQFIKAIIQRICHPVTEEKFSLLKSSFDRCSIDIYFQLIKLILNHLSLSKLKSINLPVFLFMGEFDPVHPPQLTSLGMYYFPNCRPFIVPNASNMIQLDQPDITAKHIIDFLQESNKTSETQPENMSSWDISQLLQTIIENGQKIVQSVSILQINVKKSFTVWFNNEKIEGPWNQRKAKEIITYLTLNDGSTTREALYDVLWPDKPLIKAQNSLRVSLNHIKQFFGEETFDEIFSIQKESISLKCKSDSDILELTILIDRVRATKDLTIKNQLNQQLIREVQDQLFPGFYDNWFCNYRTKLEDQVLDIQYILLVQNKANHIYEDALGNIKAILDFTGEEPGYIQEMIEIYKQLNKPAEVTYWNNRFKELESY